MENLATTRTTPGKKRSSSAILRIIMSRSCVLAVVCNTLKRSEAFGLVVQQHGHYGHGRAAPRSAVHHYGKSATPVRRQLLPLSRSNWRQYMTTTATAGWTDAESDEIALSIQEKGDEIRQLKESGTTDKATLAPYVAELLALKSKLAVGPVAAARSPPPTTTPGLTRVKTADVTSDSVSDETPVMIKGWVRTVRKQKTLAFVEVNDGSNMKGIQVVLPFDVIDEDTKQEISKLSTGCAVEATGFLTISGGKDKTAVELSTTSLRIVGACPADTFPLAKKRHSLEYLRTIAHLRPRTNTLAAVSRIRSTLAGAIHSFFQDGGFTYVQTPLITASDCEGAGEMFRVTTLDLDDVDNLPRVRNVDDDNKKSNAVDYGEDFFGKPAFLTVSGQLGGETHACALGDVYTFGPTFRAENSQTARHLAEFHMVEPEMAFADLTSAMDNAESMLKSVVSVVLEKRGEDLQFFNNFYEKGLLERLHKLVNVPFIRLSYREAVEILQEEIAKDPSKWQFPEVVFGTDLSTEHERWLAETKFESAVFVYNYPKSIKAFYMRDNDSDGGETVNAMDLLVPGVGELVGGSQREERLDVLTKKMEELDLDPKDYWWYLDLRRFGSVPHSGYGLGFERLVTYVCGIDNIRDAIAFPRYPGNAEF